MTERPILFSAQMVLAILDGRKTQTRRIIKPVQPREDGMWPAGRNPVPDCPYGQPGQRLWVRETFKPVVSGEVKYREGDLRYGFAYKADDAVIWNSHTTKITDLSNNPRDSGPLQFQQAPWKPSIHMPRRASRITLEITDVRVERLGEMSKADVVAEGIAERNGFPISECHAGWHEPFAELWEQINGKGSWEANPWVWVVSFRRMKP